MADVFTEKGESGMKKWTKRLLILAAAMAMCMLLGTLVSAAENAVDLPLDGTERLYTKPAKTEEEPDKVGKTLSLVKTYDNYTYQYYRIRITTGYSLLTVSGRTSNNGSLRIQLLNKDGYYVNPAGTSSDWRYTNSSRGQVLYYGVKKGYYYIKVYSSTDNYYLGADESAKGNRAGSTRGASYTLGYNSTVTGVMPCNENWKEADWYRFYLSSNSRIRIQLITKGLGYINVKVYGPGISSNGERIYTNAMNFSENTYLYRTLNGAGQYARPAGWYYIKLERSTSRYPRTSCAYWLKWSRY